MVGFGFGRALLAAGGVGFVIKSTDVERSSILGLVGGFNLRAWVDLCRLDPVSSSCLPAATRGNSGNYPK